MRKIERTCAVLAACASVPTAGADITSPSIQRLPSLMSNYPARAYGLSGDGRVVVGGANPLPPGSAGNSGVRWVAGMPESLWTGPSSTTFAFGASADGSVVVGQQDLSGGLRTSAVRYAGGTSTVISPNTGLNSYAAACSADGSISVGVGLATAMKWVGNTPQALPLASGYSFGAARGVSADGATIVGTCDNNSNTRRAVRWQANVPTTLPFPTGYTRVSEALDISADASSIVGFAENSSFRLRACLWQGGSAVDLGALPVLVGLPVSKAIGVSGDGTFIVGLTGHTDSTSENIADPVAFVWTQQLGMLDLASYLHTVHGIDTTGWRLDDIAGISDDGRTFAGNGYYPDGGYGPWIATVPGPTAFFTLALTAGFGLRRKRSR